MRSKARLESDNYFSLRHFVNPFFDVGGSNEEL